MNELNSYSFFLRTAVSMWMGSMGIEVFMNRTVHEVLWGFKDPLLSKLHAMRPEVDEHFGLMYNVRICSFIIFSALVSLNGDKMRPKWVIYLCNQHKVAHASSKAHIRNRISKWRYHDPIRCRLQMLTSVSGLTQWPGLL